MWLNVKCAFSLVQCHLLSLFQRKWEISYCMQPRGEMRLQSGASMFEIGETRELRLLRKSNLWLQEQVVKPNLHYTNLQENFAPWDRAWRTYMYEAAMTLPKTFKETICIRESKTQNKLQQLVLSWGGVYSDSVWTGVYPSSLKTPVLRVILAEKGTHC